jgi:8-oxo-dGTP pyrophosphatase MutT (NUDIX family)
VPDLHADATAVLVAWQAPTPDQERLRQDYLAHLSLHPDGVWRRCRTGHLTSSALIVDPAREGVLLTLHPKVGRWLQTGGHCEASDDSLSAAALREAQEEGGIADLTILEQPIRLDRHVVPCRADSGETTRLEHLDVQWCAIAPAGALEVRSEESTDLRWWSWQALPENTDDSVRALVTAAREALAP